MDVKYFTGVVVYSLRLFSALDKTAQLTPGVWKYAQVGFTLVFGFNKKQSELQQGCDDIHSGTKLVNLSCLGKEVRTEL